MKDSVIAKYSTKLYSGYVINLLTVYVVIRNQNLDNG